MASPCASNKDIDDNSSTKTQDVVVTPFKTLFKNKRTKLL
jgi:hypothetical protein